MMEASIPVPDQIVLSRELAERLRRISSFLAPFQDRGFEFGHWESPKSMEPGVLVSPYVALSDIAKEFVETAYDAGWVLTDFDWGTWAESTEANDLTANEPMLEKATSEQLAKLLTWQIRMDRFSEGSLLSSFESGLLTRILKRAQTLTGERALLSSDNALDSTLGNQTGAGLSKMGVVPQTQDIEDLLADLVDDYDFRHIDKHLRRFNLFEAVGAVRGELRHSNFLSFVLSPTRSHGIGSELLLQFIRAAIAKQLPIRRVVRSIELMVADLDSAVIHREQDNIDLLIEIRQLKLVVLVENKIDAAVGDGQLLRYKGVVRSRYPDFRHLFILLTPDGIEPDDDDYIGLSYSEIADLVDSSIERNELFGPEISLILKHYVQMLRRHIVEDERLAGLARQVYERHKEAFDFIIEQRPQPDNLLDGIKALLADDAELTEDHHSPMILRFVPKAWSAIENFNSCPETRWTHSKRNLLFEVKANRDTDRIYVSLVSGPADAEFRKKIYEFAKGQPKLFVGLVKPMGAKTATIFSKDLLSASAAASMEDDEKRESLTKAWTEFLAKDLSLIKVELANLT